MAAVKGISKLSGQAKSNTYPQPEGVLGDCMLLYGKKLGEDTVFCKFLSKNVNVLRVFFEDGEPNFVIQMDTVWREGHTGVSRACAWLERARDVVAARMRHAACTSRGGGTLAWPRSDAHFFVSLIIRFSVPFYRFAVTRRARSIDAAGTARSHGSCASPASIRQYDVHPIWITLFSCIPYLFFF